MSERHEGPPVSRGLLSRRGFLTQATAGGFIFSSNWGSGLALQLEAGSAPPIPEPHFPDRLHLFIWRNWELANTERMAEVVGTTADRILEIGTSLGLPPKPRLTEEQLGRIYITTIRQNWHVLPPDQLVRLLGWSREELEKTLKEDDMLFVKVGRVRPDNPVLHYRPPSPEARRKVSELRNDLEDIFGEELRHPGEVPFHFIRDLSSTEYQDRQDRTARAELGEVSLDGWVIESSDVAAAPLVEDLRRYLQESFGWKPVVGPGSAPGRLTLRVNSAAGSVPESFKVVTEAHRIEVTAPHWIGLRQAVSYVKDAIEERGAPLIPEGTVRRVRRLSPAFLYSYFALFGDPLMEDDVDPFPEGYLQKLSRLGVTGVWLQAILHNLAPSSIFPEFGEGSEKRLQTLLQLLRMAMSFFPGWQRGVTVGLLQLMWCRPGSNSAMPSKNSPTGFLSMLYPPSMVQPICCD